MELEEDARPTPHSHLHPGGHRPSLGKTTGKDIWREKTRRRAKDRPRVAERRREPGTLTGEAIRKHLLGLRVVLASCSLCASRWLGHSQKAPGGEPSNGGGGDGRGPRSRAALLEPLPAPVCCGLHARRQPAAWQPHLPATRSPSTPAQRSAGEPAHPCPNLSAVEGGSASGQLPGSPFTALSLSAVAAEFLSVSICKMGLITVPSQRPGESWDECLTRGGGLWCGVPAGRWVALFWKLTCCLPLTRVRTSPSLACGQSECLHHDDNPRSRWSSPA